MSQILALNGLLSIGAAATVGVANDILLQSVGMGGQLGILKFSRINESEADHLGLIFMALAGYDPSAAPLFWQRMSKLTSGSQPQEWLSTPPSHQTRISDLNKWQEEAVKYYKLNKSNNGI
jgi:predicted Zn-dependent protease